MLYPFEMDEVSDYAYAMNYFSKEECGKIIEIGNSLEQVHSEIRNGSVQEKIRKSKNSWIFPSPETDWIFYKLREAVMYLNTDFFKFKLYGFSEPLQFTKYDEKKSHYKTHLDRGYKMPIRKLSVSIQLTDPKEYKGCKLLINNEKMKPECYSLGTVVCFPSFMPHTVTKLKKGERYSLVTWVTGDNFK